MPGEGCRTVECRKGRVELEEKRRVRSEATFVKQKCKEQTVQEGSGNRAEKAKRNEKKVRNVKFDVPAAKYPCK